MPRGDWKDQYFQSKQRMEPKVQDAIAECRVGNFLNFWRIEEYGRKYGLPTGLTQEEYRQFRIAYNHFANYQG